MQQNRTNAGRRKLLYIAAHSRSGSTLLEKTIGSSRNAFATGELRYIWSRSLRDNQLCGCGDKFKDCEFWTSIIAETKLPDDVNNFVRLQKNVDRLKNFLALEKPALRSASFSRNLAEFREPLLSLYSKLFESIEGKVLVDSSKSPNYALILSQTLPVEMYVLHLVRDSRAVAFSRMRPKKRPEIYWKDEYMSITKPRTSAWQWVVLNLAIERLKHSQKYLRLRYEDFVENPKKILSEISSWLGEDIMVETTHDGRKFQATKQHSVAGNPMRFKCGQLEIRKDNEWTKRLGLVDKCMVSGISWPWLVKYGYDL